jgi:hypothetical protein
MEESSATTPANEVLDRRKGVPDRRKGVLDPRWQGLCQHIHTTDDISFKLLALVPLVSIAAIATALLKETVKFTPVVALLSLFAAAVTVALWIWERRNLQTCLWLISRAAELEKNAFGTKTPGQFFAAPEEPDKRGKRAAERQVYGLTVGAWLLLPGAAFASQWGRPLSLATLLDADRYLLAGAGAYALAAGMLGWHAWHALHVDIKIMRHFKQCTCKEVLPNSAPT